MCKISYKLKRLPNTIHYKNKLFNFYFYINDSYVYVDDKIVDYLHFSNKEKYISFPLMLTLATISFINDNYSVILLFNDKYMTDYINKNRFSDIIYFPKSVYHKYKPISLKNGWLFSFTNHDKKPLYIKCYNQFKKRGVIICDQNGNIYKKKKSFLDKFLK